MALTIRFSEHFRQRRSEWMLATAMLCIGSVYLTSPGLFDSPYFSSMRLLMTQQAWGYVVSFLGTMRLTMLWINGRWGLSPYFRAGGAVGGAALWAILFASAVSSERIVQSVVLWAVFCFFDLFAARDAAGDARRTYELRTGAADGRDV